MSREHYLKLFSDHDKLTQLVNLRYAGYSCSTLASLYHCDISSVRHQLDKYGIWPIGEVYTLERMASSILYQLTGTNLIERIARYVLSQTQLAAVQYEEEYGKLWAKGKTYKEYLAEQKLRSHIPI